MADHGGVPNGDVRRLGKRGAYRLGAYRVGGERLGRERFGAERRGADRLGGPAFTGGGRTGGTSASRQPSFGTRGARGYRRRLAAGWAGTAVVLGFAAAFGLWFAPFVVGVIAGAGLWRLRAALGWTLSAVAVGWAASLYWPAWSGAPVGSTARTISALAGLPASTEVGVVAALAIGVLQGLAGLWIARAVTYSRR